MIIDAVFQEVNNTLGANFGVLTKGEKGDKGDKGETGEVSLAYANGTFANVIKGTAKGSAIAVRDVSPIEHSVGCRVASKNLFDYNEFINQANSVQSGWGGTTTQFGEECFWFKGVTPSSSFKFMQGEFLENTQYTLSFECAYVHNNDVSYNLPIFVICYTDGTKENVTRLTYTDKFVQQSHTTKANKTVDYITTNELASTLKIYIKTNIQLELGTTATAYTPYVEELGGIEVSRYGKNLFGATYEDFINAEKLGDGKQIFFTLKPNTSYTLSSNMYRNTDTSTNIWFNGTAGGANGVWENKPSTTMTDNNGKLYILVRETKLEELFNNYWLQLEESTSATPYEPFTKQTYQSTADGTVEGVTSVSPNMTLISNNDGAVINCNYNIDTKTYIDNKFAELQALILEG